MKKFERMNFRLYPTKEQEKIMLLNCNNARFAYNWAIAQINTALDNKQAIPSKYKLASEFAKFKKQPGYEWLCKNLLVKELQNLKLQIL